MNWIHPPEHIQEMRKNDIEKLGGIKNYQIIMLFYNSLIKDVGERLNLRQQVIATAIVYFKRFYIK